MAEKRVNVRLAAVGGRQVRAALEGVGTAGQRGMGRLRREIDAALEAYALAPLADRLAGTLSAGQKRRAGLARLMVTGRPIWVLDEPTVSLDIAAVGMFADAVRAHLDGGGMALLATHIDLGIEAQVLDITGMRAAPDALHGASDEAFL
jgi:heme exporter protein A